MHITANVSLCRTNRWALVHYKLSAIRECSNCIHGTRTGINDDTHTLFMPPAKIIQGSHAALLNGLCTIALFLGIKNELTVTWWPMDCLNSSKNFLKDLVKRNMQLPIGYKNTTLVFLARRRESCSCLLYISSQRWYSSFSCFWANTKLETENWIWSALSGRLPWPYAKNGVRKCRFSICWSTF